MEELGGLGCSYNGMVGSVYAPVGDSSGVTTDEHESIHWFGEYPSRVRPVLCASCQKFVGYKVVDHLVRHLNSLQEHFNGNLVLMRNSIRTSERKAIWLTMPSPVDALDKLAFDFMSQHGMVGLQATFQLDDAKAISRHWGYSSAVVTEEDAPRMSAATRLRNGSISKAITGVAILQLVERRRLELDERVLPILRRRLKGGGDLFLRAEADPRLEEVTVRHLLHHVSGFWRVPEFDVGDVKSLPSDTLQLIREAIVRGTLADPPGLKFDYCNFGYVVLARVIEAQDELGRSYEQYCRDEILAKAGIDLDPEAGIGPYPRQEHVVGYYMPQPGPVENTWRLSAAPERLTSEQDADGGWVLSTDELVRFSRAVDDGRLVGAASRRLLSQPLPQSNNYALGWMVADKGSTRFQLGFLEGTACVLTHTERDGGATWALTSNTSKAELTTVAELEGFGWSCLPEVRRLSRRFA